MPLYSAIRNVSVIVVLCVFIVTKCNGTREKLKLESVIGESKKFILHPIEKLNWFQAYEYCAKRGLRLLTIVNQATDEKDLIPVLDKKKLTEIWTAGIAIRDTWIWMTTGVDVSLNVRKTDAIVATCSHPTRCLSASLMHPHLRYEQQSCTKKLAFLCEIH